MGVQNVRHIVKFLIFGARSHENLASEGNFKKSFTKKCIISKINFQKICVPVCAHHFPPKNFRIFF